MARYLQLIEKKIEDMLMNIRKKIKKNDGMSLLEVLISMVILGIALLMLLNMAMISLTSNTYASKWQ